MGVLVFLAAASRSLLSYRARADGKRAVLQTRTDMLLARELRRPFPTFGASLAMYACRDWSNKDSGQLSLPSGNNDACRNGQSGRREDQHG